MAQDEEAGLTMPFCPRCCRFFVCCDEHTAAEQVVVFNKRDHLDSEWCAATCSACLEEGASLFGSTSHWCGEEIE